MIYNLRLWHTSSLLLSFAPAQYVDIQLGRKPRSRLELYPNAKVV